MWKILGLILLVALCVIAVALFVRGSHKMIEEQHEADVKEEAESKKKKLPKSEKKKISKKKTSKDDES